MTCTLKKRKASHKDYSFHKSYNLGAAVLPDNFWIDSRIPNQDANDCTAFSAVEARNSEIPASNFDPAQFWNDELAFAGVKTSDGFDIEVPAAVGVEKGFSPIGNPTIRQSNASAYFWIHANNGLDLFDSVRQTIYSQKRPAVGGLDWFQDWVNTVGGIISAIGLVILGGHAIRIAGWKTENNVLYIGLPNTWGVNVGDNGVFWMTREVFNKSFSGYGIYIWSDDQSVQIKTLGLIQALYQNVVTLLRNL